MVVWGGLDFTLIQSLGTGGVYEPAADGWTVTSTTGRPSARESHTAVWTGSRMIVWGGSDRATQDQSNDGGIYDPATDTWAAVSTTGAPRARSCHGGVDRVRMTWARWITAPRRRRRDLRPPPPTWRQ
jgi:hypothetical protein